MPPTLALLATEQQFERGDFLYRPADRMESIFVLQEGFVKLGGYGPEGGEAVYDTLIAGDFCGNLKYLGGRGGFAEFARALLPTRAYTIDRRAFRRALLTDGALHEWFLPLLVRRWARAEQRLFRIASLSPADRLAALLNECGEATVPVRELLTQSDLAALTGLSRQTVARLLRAL